MVSFQTLIKGNILDLLITNCPDRVLSAEDVGRLGRSHYSMIQMELEFSKRKVSFQPSRTGAERTSKV
jgi:hypothetical protein